MLKYKCLESCNKKDFLIKLLLAKSRYFCSWHVSQKEEGNLMGRKVNKECGCGRKTKKRKHGRKCPACGGTMESVSENAQSDKEENLEDFSQASAENLIRKGGWMDPSE